MPNIDPIDHSKKRKPRGGEKGLSKPGEPQTEAGKARLRRAQEEMEAGRRAALGGEGPAAFGPAAGGVRRMRRRGMPEELEEPEEERKEESRRREEPRREKEKEEPEEKEEEPEEEKKEGKEAPEEEAQKETEEPQAEAPPEETPSKTPEKAPAENLPQEGQAAGERTVAGGEAAAEGGVAAGEAAGAAAGEVAVAEGEAAAATGGVSILVQVIAVILIGIVIIILIIAIAFIISQIDGAGRTAKQEPNQNAQTDMTDKGKAVANAGGGVNTLVQAKGMAGDDSYNQLKDEINTNALKVVGNNLLLPKALAAGESPTEDNLTSLSQELSLDLEVLQSGAGDDIFVAEQTNKISQISNRMQAMTNNCQPDDSSCATINEDAKKMTGIMEEINNYTFTEKKTTLDNQQTIVKTKTGVEINPLDLSYIKDNKVDVRVLRLINSLASAGWDRLKISRIVDFDPNDDESQVASEDEANISAHNSGQAIDISIVGTYTCKKKDWSNFLSGGKTYHLPCYVYYQTGARPNFLTPYGNPRGNSFDQIFTNFAFDEASKNLNLGNFDGNSFGDFLIQAGTNALIEEMGMTPRIYNFPTTDYGFGAYALGESLGIDPNVFSQMISAKNTNESMAAFGAGVLSQAMDLPSGSFVGNNRDEILRSIAVNYLKQSLGLERTSPMADFSPQNVGSALLEKILLTRDPDATKQRLSLDENTLNKSLNLPPNIASDFKNGQQSYEQFASNIGANQINVLNSTYKNGGIERSLGLPAGSWPGAAANDGSTMKKIGAAVLARYVLMDENSAYTDPDAFVNNLGKQAAVNITVISPDDFAGMVKGEDAKGKLNNIAKNYLSDKNGGSFNYQVRQGMQKLNIASGKITSNDFDKVFAPAELHDILYAVNNSALETSIYSYQAQFGNYTMDTSDIERIRQGDLSTTAYKVGGALFDQSLNLPSGFSQSLIESRQTPKDLLSQAGISLLAQALGIDVSSQALSYSWYGQGAIPQKLAQTKIEAKGFKPDSFKGNIDNVIAQNGTDPVISALALNQAEYDLLRASGGNDYIKSKLYGVDAAWGVPNGTAFNFATGAATADQVVSSLSGSLTQTIKNAGIPGIATSLGLDQNHLPSGDLLSAFLGQDSGAIVGFFSSLADSSVNQNLLNNNNFFTSLVSGDPANLKSVIASEGLNIFSKLISPKAPNPIISLLTNSYLNGGALSPSDTLKNATGVTNNGDVLTFLGGQAKSAVSYWGIGQITNAVNQTFGKVGINYDQARVLFAGDPNSAQAKYDQTIASGGSQQQATFVYRETMNQTRGAAGKSVGYAYLDLGLNRIDPNIPYGASQILIDGTSEERSQFALNYFASKIQIGGVPLSGGTLNGVINYFKTGNFDDLNPQVFAAADSTLGLPPGTVQTIQNFVQNNGAFGFDVSDAGGWAASSFNGWFQKETGFDLNSVINFQQSIASGQIVAAGDPETIITNLLINWAIGEFGSKIDSALGMPGFTSAAVSCAIPPHYGCIQLGMILLGKLFGFSIHCQDPVAITREHIRLVLGQALNAPDTPSQIATYRQEDVNYYSGLNDKDEIDMRLQNILYEKYGPVSLRVYKGMFTLPWTYDHIHIGY